MSAATTELPGNFRLDYGRDLEAELDRLAAAFATHELDTAPYPARWLALKLLEAEGDVIEQIAARPGGAACVGLARERAAHLEATLGDEVGILTADRRYGFINGVARQVLQAQEYWRLRGMRADVVILNEHPATYLDEMQAQLTALLNDGPWSAWQHRRPRCSDP